MNSILKFFRLEFNLEIFSGAATVARTWSAYIDAAANHWISNKTLEMQGGQFMATEILGPYPDFLAFVLIILVGILISTGAKVSAMANNIFTGINLIVIAFIIVLGFIYADLKNWTNFAPFGVSGIIDGTARCFVAFIGFETIGTAAEEAKNPKKIIPRATIISMSIVTAAYSFMSASLTLNVKIPKI